jgi:hypothetical protein
MHPTRPISTAVSETNLVAFGCYFYYISRFWGSLSCFACLYRSDDTLILHKELDVTSGGSNPYTWHNFQVFLLRVNNFFIFTPFLIINIRNANFGVWEGRQILWSIYSIYLFTLYIRLQYQFLPVRLDFIQTRTTPLPPPPHIRFSRKLAHIKCVRMELKETTKNNG